MLPRSIPHTNGWPMPSTSQTFVKVLKPRPGNKFPMQLSNSTGSGFRCWYSQWLVRIAFIKVKSKKAAAPTIHPNPSHWRIETFADFSLKVGSGAVVGGSEDNVEDSTTAVSVASSTIVGFCCGRTAKGMVSKGGTRHLAKTISQSIYRTWALLFFSANDAAAITNVMTANCQLWVSR